MRKYQAALLASAITLGLAGCDETEQRSETSDAVTLSSLEISCEEATTAENLTGDSISLTVVGSYISGNEFDTSSAEIVSYDSCSDKLYTVNAEDGTVDVIAIDSGSAPTKDGTIDLTSAATLAGIEIGNANSVSAKQGLVAVAIEADTKQDAGIIALYRSDTLELLNVYPAGALPDMVMLTEDAATILTANEGEPSDDYSNDPEGSVTIVDISAGLDDDNAVISQVSFSDYNSDGSMAGQAQAAGVRLSGPDGTSASQDLEPEYLTVANGKAYVALQENNALAIVDIDSASVDALVGLGTKSWNSASGNQLDPSNKDDAIGNFQSFEQLVGYYMPDTITSYSVDGTTYLVTANEGDGREYIYQTTQQACESAGHSWDGDEYLETDPEYTTEEGDCISYTDEGRGDDLNVDAGHPLVSDLQDETVLGRIKVVMDDDEIGADDNVYSFGARSFTIWNTDGTVVYDSGDEIAQQVYAADPDNFNSTNDNNDSADDRADDKGTEPEAVEVAIIDDQVLIFVGLERQGGIMVFDATDPENTEFEFYINNRDFSADVCTTVDEGDCDDDTYNPAALDLGPESIDYFAREGGHFIAVGNEVSGTTTVYQIEKN